MLSGVLTNISAVWAKTRGARRFRFNLVVLATIVCFRSTSARAQVAPVFPRDRADVREPEDPSRHREPHGERNSERILVRFQAHVAERVRQTIRAAAGVTRVRHRFRAIKGLELLEVPVGRVGFAVAALRRYGVVRYAEPDYRVRAVDVPDDPEFAQLWGLQNTGQSVNGITGTAGADINVVPAWEAWTGDTDFRIAVIDTGIQWDHPDLQANVWTNPGEIPSNGIDDDENGWVDDVHGYDFLNDDGDPYDDEGHGTHVAGTIGAVGNNATGITGVNWHCSIVGLKFLDSNGNGLVSGAVEALDYVLANRIAVSNNSWGGPNSSQALRDAIEASQAVGHLFVAAAGNDRTDTDSIPFYPASIDLPNILSVAAINNRDELASFSNYGSLSVDVAAPGVDIYSTLPVGEYGFESGTSMAAPHVAGVAALVWSRYPTLTWQETKARLLDSARPAPSLDGLLVTGGVVDAEAALRDCNGNGIADAQDILDGASEDCSGNGVPDECESDCNANAVPDSCDTFFGSSADCNANETPDECEPDCNLNGVPDECEISDGTSMDCNRNAVPDTCDVADPANDCNDNGIPDTCDIADGASVDCNENRIPDECLDQEEPDCNANSVPDSCDIATGQSPDCDLNSVPDECEVLPDCNGNGVGDSLDICHGVSADCNLNDVPDECDIDSGTTNDCNGNSIPDVCEFDALAFVQTRLFRDPSPEFVAALRNLGYIVALSAPAETYDVLINSGNWSLNFSDRARLQAGEMGLIYLDVDLAADGVSDEAYPFTSHQPWQLREGARVIDMASPITLGLSTQSGLRGLAMRTTLRPGANTVIAWDDGTPMVVTYRYGAGRVVYINNAGGWLGSSYWDGDSEFGRRLFRNVLLWVTPHYLDCNQNGQLDSCEIAAGGTADSLPLGGDGILDECQTDCNANGVPDAEDIRTGVSMDCDSNGVSDECPAPGVDCDGNGALDVCEIEAAGEDDCNGNGLLDSCEPDCNQNGDADACELLGGVAADCNLNSIPDSCESSDCALGPRAAYFGAMPYPHLHLVTMKQLGLNVQTLNRFIDVDDPAQYDLIVLGAFTYHDTAALSAAMDAYIHAGGAVIFFVEDRRGAIPYTGLGSPLEDVGIPFYLLDDHVEVVDPADPLVAGLGPVGAFVGIGAVPVLKSSAHVVTRWRDSFLPHVVTYEYGAGRVVWINHLESASEPPWTTDPVFGARLFKNAVSWVLAGMLDCNGNGIDDATDIAEGTSNDELPAGGDGIPDECQSDCNVNGVPDDLDISNGTSPDLNANGTPDECEHVIPAVSNWGIVEIAITLLIGATLVFRRSSSELPKS